MSMYIRFKRKNQTLFLHAEPSNNFSQLKARIGEILSIDPSRIQIIGSDKKKEMVDMATLSDQEIQSDDILYMVFAKETGGGWEELQVDTLSPMGENASFN